METIRTTKDLNQQFEKPVESAIRSFRNIVLMSLR